MQRMNRQVLGWIGLLAIGLLVTAVRSEDALDRMTRKKLKATREAIEGFKQQRQEKVLPGPLKVYRANLHVHSLLSHDSRGKPEEIVAAAKRADTDVIMFTEHPAPHYDFVKDGHQGLRDGVLLIPGAETKGLLAYPSESVRESDQVSTEEFAKMVQQLNGMAFISHLEERMDLAIPGITGNEIYNTHADFKEEKRLMSSMRNPLWLLNTAPLLKEYPQESLLALQDYPQQYLARWGELCKTSHHTGVAANDAHQNVGVRIRVIEGDKVRLEDALGEKLVELNRKAAAELVPIPEEAKEGDVVFELLLDPYERSLRHAGTYLLMREQTKEAVWESLQAGRAYVCFDGLASGRGFSWRAKSGEASCDLGGEISASTEIEFQGVCAQDATWKIIRDGQIVYQSQGYECSYRSDQKGIYRAELWLDTGRPQIWILTNPIYVK
jgi:hypothetical protein